MKHISINNRKEAFARVKTDGLLKDADWKLTDGLSVLFEEKLPDGTKDDLERRAAVRQFRRDLSTVDIDRKLWTETTRLTTSTRCQPRSRAVAAG
ncbi:hypothetical protein [Candidatus Synechococcus spongiarum]|uniref:Uncharacterized protein n=1 Tax=Candidatus Synechococcus spongiarum TaxID=431041 RepID=A0A170T405_9SYNE|nr:hypothetical protein [Candidatus Synechococcus spongiarum]CZB11445.1 hypothetical protein FLM9_106 [Candidatus Synechococcus spongiarum]